MLTPEGKYQVIPGTAIERLNAKNAKLRQKTLSYRHRETACGPITVGNVVLAKKIGTYVGWIDCVLVCTAVLDKMARFSGYTDQENLVGEYRWNATELNDLIASGTLTVIEND